MDDLPLTDNGEIDYWEHWQNAPMFSSNTHEIINYLKAIAAHEREQCADEVQSWKSNIPPNDAYRKKDLMACLSADDRDDTLDQITQAIRERKCSQ